MNKNKSFFPGGRLPIHEIAPLPKPLLCFIAAAQYRKFSNGDIQKNSPLQASGLAQRGIRSIPSRNALQLNFWSICSVIAP
jgi:hypothetical protein